MNSTIAQTSQETSRIVQTFARYINIEAKITVSQKSLLVIT